MKQNKKMSTDVLVLGAVLTAIVLVLQLLGASIRFGAFSITLVLIPVVIGAATCGIAVSSWLGGVFGIAVLLSGDAGAFLAVNWYGTIITVMAKGIGCGFAAGVVYKLLNKKNKYVAVVAAAIVCPLVNTGIFLLGCALFFMPTITEWAGGTDVATFIITAFVGFNFLFEMGTNLVLSPVVVRLLNLKKQ